MPVINVLDRHVAELIAAGEVVERPSSVIKELVENSIDAGATSVTVEIKNGGSTYMRVTDNGCGIGRQDVPKAFLRHATSKILTQDDLDSIGTLGFRGEALASVCAVARVELLTRCDDENIGTHYTISGSDEVSLDDAGCPKGTTIIVRDLFYNVPARMKFLKKDVSEGNSVAGVMDRIALSHPEVSFTFIRDGKQQLNTPGNGDIKAAVYAVYGREFTSNLLSVSYNLNGVNVIGFISKPTAARANRNMQHFYINGRYVQSRTAMAALEEACKGSVMVGKFPACVLYLNIPNEAVDVNVHPAKIEVRFIDERPIFDAVYHAVKNTILNQDKPNHIILDADKKKTASLETSEKSSALSSTKKTFVDGVINTAPLNSADNSINNTEISVQKVDDPAEAVSVDMIKAAIKSNTPIINIIKEHSDTKKSIVNDYEDPQISIPPKPRYDANAFKAAKTDSVHSSAQSDSIKPFAEIFEKSADDDIKIVGEAFETYIIVQRGKDELIIIDKHAAHERMIYEKLKKDKGSGFAQYLLEPVAVKTSKQEYDVLLENSELLNEAGFEIEDFGNGTILVRSAPQYLANYSVKASIEEIAGHLLENRHSVHTEQIDWIYHSISCRAAIKAGHKTSSMEMLDMAKKLIGNPDVMYCPHGRPTSIIMTKKELEKQFGRIQ